MTRRPSPPLAAVLAATLLASACATTGARPAGPVEPTLDQRRASILGLEDQRILRATPPAPPADAAGAAAPPAAPGPDLVALTGDREPQIRRRAALAIGRVGLAEGVAPLAGLLAGDPEPEVRQMAAFAIGLIGDESGAEPLMAALADPDPRVQGRAAEALGLIGFRPAADAVATMVKAHLAAGVLDGIDPDDMGYPKGVEVEAVRLGLYALTRLGAYGQLAGAMVGPDGLPTSRWWPVAYAFQRIEDPRAAGVLMALLDGGGQLTRAFAARGLGAIRHAPAAPALLALAGSDREPEAVRVQALRALTAIGAPETADLAVRLLTSPDLSRNLRLEAMTALTAFHPESALDLLLDLVSAPWASMRAGALQALAATDPQTFLAAISGLDPDPQWSVRAALAAALGQLDAERAMPRLTVMLDDGDQRVVPAVLDAIVKVGAPSAGAILIDKLGSDDPVVRLAAARGLATVRPAGAGAALAAAFDRAQRDGTYVARAGILTALAVVDPAAGREAAARALGDQDWAMRLRAAEILETLDPSADTRAIRPAPASPVAALSDNAALAAPEVTPIAYIDTEQGTIEVELAVIDAPRTVANFTALAARGFFNGTAIHRVVPDFVVQDGDPRGDGEGGPGYTIRDEINERPYMRGTVGMALDWADTGGSQFFITHSPQPHLDGRYTVFGQVVAGMDVVDRLSQWDVIRSVRVWDGVRWIGDTPR
ncbi:MAG: HEAT repeat domain-containing protein [Vicinamibacterales bacterium]